MILTIDNPGVPYRRVATIGSFDGVHRGHIYMLQQLIVAGRRLGLRPAVITFSMHPRVLTRGHAPLLTTLRRRLELIEDAGVEDVVVLDFDESMRRMTAAEFMAFINTRFGVDALLLGFNNRFGSDRLKDYADYCKAGMEAGVEVLRGIEWGNEAVSSTMVREALASGDVEIAARLLGREYSLEGQVVHGRALGRTIGFPTANVVPTDEPCIVPCRGVYAVDVVLPDGDVRRGIMNIGHRPTVDNGDDDTLEVHVLDYDGDLYGAIVDVKLLKRLRDERKFDSIDQLRSQLEADAAEARAFRTESR